MTKTNEYDDDEELISRTAQKKAAQLYITTGEQLLALSPSQLSTIPLNPSLVEAIAVAKKIKVGNALKRQMSFIGKLIRNNNYEEIQAALEHLKQQGSQYEQIAKMAETWRERLITEEPKALATFIDEYPRCDRQQLNQLVRHAIKEDKTHKMAEDKTKTSSKYKKSLFKLLRNNIAEQHGH